MKRKPKRHSDRPGAATDKLYRMLKMKSPELVPETDIAYLSGTKTNAITQVKHRLKDGEKLECKTIEGGGDVKYYRIVQEAV